MLLSSTTCSYETTTVFQKVNNYVQEIRDVPESEDDAVMAQPEKDGEIAEKRKQGDGKWAIVVISRTE